MKKPLTLVDEKKKLRLSLQTVRGLAASELHQVVGGAPKSGGVTCGPSGGC